MNPVGQAFKWIGFSTEDNCNIICDEVGLEAFENFVIFTESNIWDMTSGFSMRTAAQGRVNFGMRRVNITY